MSKPELSHSTADFESCSSRPTASLRAVTAHGTRLRRLVEAPTPPGPSTQSGRQSPTRRSGRITRLAGPTALLGPRCSPCSTGSRAVR